MQSACKFASVGKKKRRSSYSLQMIPSPGRRPAVQKVQVKVWFPGCSGFRSVNVSVASVFLNVGLICIVSGNSSISAEILGAMLR